MAGTQLLNTMNKRIAEALRARAISAGFGLRFRQLDNGAWEARWTSGRNTMLWCGTLAEVWDAAGGVR